MAGCRAARPVEPPSSLRPTAGVPEDVSQPTDGGPGAGSAGTPHGERADGGVRSGDQADGGAGHGGAAGGFATDPLAAVDAAFARGETDQAIAACEDAAPRSPDPSALLIRAARARKLRIAAAFAAPDAAASMPALARDAEACAADAHGAWSAQFPSAVGDGTRPAAEVYAQVGAAGAEALYLEAVCTAAFLRAQGFTQLVERRTELLGELQRAAQLAPGLDDAGPDRELGALYGALPSSAGGDLAAARRHFEAACALAADVAANHLQFARSVAVKSQDRQLFEAQLRLAAASKDPAAAAQAADLLSREDDLFDPAGAAQPTPGGGPN